MTEGEYDLKFCLNAIIHALALNKYHVYLVFRDFRELHFFWDKIRTLIGPFREFGPLGIYPAQNTFELLNGSKIRLITKEDRRYIRELNIIEGEDGTTASVIRYIPFPR